MPSSKPILGVNDLQSQFPELAKEWHPTRNSDLKPREVKSGSNKKVWWQCNKDPEHEWESAIHPRSIGIGCPFCSGKRVLEGFNDLTTTEPQLAKEWHPSRNDDLKPTEVTRGSGKKIWWQCNKHPEHEWISKVSDRTNGSGCPVCIGQKVLEGFNDLTTTEPQLAKEWHPTRNAGLEPTEVTSGSNKKVWWQCITHPDHEWQARPLTRTGGSGCPICGAKKVLEGFNDLTTTEPQIAKEWHPTRNDDLKPTEVTRGSGKKIWWQCNKHPEHEWQSTISNRSKGSGCPVCIGQKVLEGFNDLTTTHPKIALEWHPIKNGNLKPTEFSKSSIERVWWQCSKYPDHQWDASVADRTKSDGCPICSNQRVLEGFNDLTTTEPQIAKEWHPIKNGNLKPTEFTRGASKKIWWQCSKHPEHEWESPIGNRSTGFACPFCAEYGFNPSKDAWFYLMQRPGEQQLGITNVLSDRLRKHESNGWMLLEHTVPASGQKVLDTEKAFKQWLKKEIGLMKGTTENWSTTKMEVQSLAELKARSGIETDLF